MSLFLYEVQKLTVHAVEHGCESALLSCSVVFVKNTVSYSLVDLLNSLLVSFLSESLVAGNDSSFILLHVSLESCLEHFILKSFCFDNFYALFRGLDIRHRIHLLVDFDINRGSLP